MQAGKMQAMQESAPSRAFARQQVKERVMHQSTRTVNVGLIGLGTVGGGVFQLIESHAEKYRRAYGIDLRIARACGLDESRARELGVTAEQFTTDWRDVVSDPRIDIVVEVIGGEHPATEIFTEAFAAGKHVVSANKALLGRHMAELAGAANAAGVQLRCEASCGGGIPIVGTLEHDLTGNNILAIAGIVNGTTNYILSRMTTEGLGYEEVLADAQRLGYAEADPTADVDGFDAASKIAILSSIGFTTRITTDDVYMQGIRKISAEDIEVARELGYAIKMLAIGRRTDEGVDIRVHPAMIPASHPLAGVNGAMNAVYVVGDAVGETMFYGAGAGAFPTASAIVGDVMNLAEDISAGVKPLPEPAPFARELPIRNVADLETRYYVRLTADGTDGVATGATEVLNQHGVTVERVIPLENGSFALLTNTCREGNMFAALGALSGAVAAVEVANVIRIEDIADWTQGVEAN